MIGTGMEQAMPMEDQGMNGTGMEQAMPMEEAIS